MKLDRETGRRGSGYGAELEFVGALRVEEDSLRSSFWQLPSLPERDPRCTAILPIHRALAAQIEKDESVAWIVQAYAHRAPNSCVCLTKAERKRPKACVRVLTFACWLLAAAVDSRTFVLLRYVTKRVGES